MAFENVTNVVFTNTSNFNLNPIELSNRASIFCSVLFHHHLFMMFLNTRQLNCIISCTTNLDLKKNVACPYDVFTTK